MNKESGQPSECVSVIFMLDAVLDKVSAQTDKPSLRDVDYKKGEELALILYVL